MTVEEAVEYLDGFGGPIEIDYQPVSDIWLCALVPHPGTVTDPPSGSGDSLAAAIISCAESDLR